MKSFWSTLVFAILGLAFVQKPSLAASPEVVSDEILKNGCIPWRVSGKRIALTSFNDRIDSHAFYAFRSSRLANAPQ